MNYSFIVMLKNSSPKCRLWSFSPICSKPFTVLYFTFWSITQCELVHCIRKEISVKVLVLFLFCLCMPNYSTYPSVDKSMFLSLNSFCTFAKNQLALTWLNLLIHLNSLSCPLYLRSVSIPWPRPLHLDYCSCK